MKASRKKIDVKNVVMPHSEAKLNLYKTYLIRYLNVLVAFQKFNKINLYDVFCGAGIYDDGKPGSPILAFDAIAENRKWCVANNKPSTRITLTVNDGKPQRVNKVKELLDAKNSENLCSLNFYNLQASEILNIVTQELNSKPNSERNLVFIDPYGYKDINAETLKAIMFNGNTEIVLFLPVSFIYRFTDYVLSETDKVQYESLRNFIYSLFPVNHPVRMSEDYEILDFIRYVKESLAFGGKFFTASHFIERAQGSYFAIFFMASHPYGLEKFLEAKWEQDPIRGKGFSLPKPATLFDQQFSDEERQDSLSWLSNQLENYLKTGKKTNQEVYLFTLNLEFRPSHATSILKEWQDGGYLKVWDIDKNQEARKGAFYISYDDYKLQNPKVHYTLK